MATLNDYRNERVRKLEELKALKVNPYPAKSNRTIDVGYIAPNFDKLEGKIHTVAGRISSIRSFGKLGFIVIRDFSGDVQLFIRKDDLGGFVPENGALGINELRLLDTGDFVEATGPVIKTKTGEVSVGVTEIRLLTKSLRTMPLKHEEFNDK